MPFLGVLLHTECEVVSVRAAAPADQWISFRKSVPLCLMLPVPKNKRNDTVAFVQRTRGG